MERIREYLSLAGKGRQKVAAVFCSDPGHARDAVEHLRRGAPEVPIWLFSTSEPPPHAAIRCERIVVGPDAMALAVRAQHELWPYWLALSVAIWTGGHGRWPVKLAPFFIPPFRVLIMNEHGDFFAASPAAISRHAMRRTRDAIHSARNRAKDIGRGTALWLFAIVAQWFSPLSRYAFHRRHGNEALEVSPAPAQADGIAVFRHARRRWDREHFRRFIDTQEARWLLVLEDHEPVDVSPWLSLFEDPRTFAVSLQQRYRGWSPALFPVAPFRQLQNDEAAQTLAPVSQAILADLGKLRALGLPDTVVSGTAWYRWFWLAAAAGWRSYCVGAGGEVQETTDWPYEEAEFVAGILSDPRQRRLGPREAALARGNIAFALPQRRIAGAKPRVLIVSPYLPYPLSHGGAVRIYNLCRALAPRVNFLLATFCERGDTIDYAKLHEVFAEVYVLDLDERAVRDPSLPRQVREHHSSSMAALIAELRREREVNLVQIEYTHMAHFRKAAGPRALLVEHDLTFTLYQQLGQTVEAERWLSLERACFREFAGIWAMSTDDRARAIAEGSPPERTFTVPNGVDILRFQPGDIPGEAPEVFYVGSFRHLPNVLGFKRLLNEIMPAIWAKFPDALLRVIGGPDAMGYLGGTVKHPRVAVHGFVADLRPLYARAAVVAVPLVVSAGTNIKVMEAMACGKAVVTTPIGCAGLDLVDGHDALIREHSADFAAAVADLLAGPAIRNRIAANARQTVERRFAWEAIADAAYASYERLW